MKLIIKHESSSRLRVHLPMKRMTFREADALDYYLQGFDAIKEAKIYERTADVAVRFDCGRKDALKILEGFDPHTIDVP